MNINRKVLIDEILNGSSTRLREKYFNNNYNDVYQEIVQYCLNINEIPFKQKLWHWVNDEPNYVNCYCGNKVKFNRNWLDGYKKYCSPKCSANNKLTKEKRLRTTLDKYGVTNVAKLEEIKEKQEKTNLEKYGTKSSFQNEEVKSKYKKTIKEKYGKEHYFQTKEFKERSKETMLDKYGKEHFTQTDIYIEKTIKTNIEKYGKDWFTQTKEYLENSKESNKERYGVDHPMKSELIQLKVKETMLDKYDKEYYFQTDDFKQKAKETTLDRYGAEHYSKSEDWKSIVRSDKYKELRLLQRIDFYNLRGFKFIRQSDNQSKVILVSDECGHEFEIHPTTLQRRNKSNLEVCTICNPIDSKQSGSELSLIKWIESLGIEVFDKNRDVIYPLELDIFIPSKNLAIEYNGLYWHSELYRDKNYHLNKLLECNKSDVDLIQVWEDDWIYKQEIVKSIIKSRLGLIDNKIHARKCEIKFVENRKLVNEFFDDNHIQGKTMYKYAVGLFYQNELVSCMLFNKPRKQFELVRFVNKINTIVNGSSSKLFKYFLKNSDVDEIASFADRSTFTGGVYKKLGFDFEYRTDPNYWWVVDGVRRHRFNYTKQKLINMGGDSNKTEVEIMYDMGYSRIWGCGLDKWVWKKQKEN